MDLNLRSNNTVYLNPTILNNRLFFKTVIVNYFINHNNFILILHHLVRRLDIDLILLLFKDKRKKMKIENRLNLDF